jgi:Cft2 family RNA processing exonuclease
MFGFNISFTGLLTKLMLPTQVCMDENSHLLFIFDLPVIPVDLKQTIQVDRDLVIRAYYAGHVCSYTYVSLASSNIYKLLDY